MFFDGFSLKKAKYILRMIRLEQIAFIGTYDKKDLILNVAKVLTECGLKVLVVDATLMQRLRYIVPKISNNSITYISEYLGIDVALGFINLSGIMQYLGNMNNIPYDYVMIDTDNIQTMNSFVIDKSKKIYVVTSYEQYELRRTIELLKYYNHQIEVTKVVISADLENKQEEYFNKLLSETPVKLDRNVIEYADTTQDRKVTLQNQLIGDLSFNHYSSTYKDSLEYHTSLIAEGRVEQSFIRRVIRKK